MDLQDRVAVITGGAGGIGKAMGAAFLDAGARAVVLADLNSRSVEATAAELGCDGRACDVTNESQVDSLVRWTLARHGKIDVFCSNAGAMGPTGLADAPNESWQRLWDLHVMAHVYAARAVLPSMIERGEGYLLNTASAAGLLAAVGLGPYTVSKAAAVKLAEFLAISHGDDGIAVSVLCPQGVNTDMSPQRLGDGQMDGILDADDVASAVLEAIAEERFLILPHEQVAEYIRRKGADPDRWIRGMRRLRRAGLGGPGG